MIKASDHDMQDFTPELKQTCYDLMTDSEKYVVKLINACVCLIHGLHIYLCM